MTNNDIIEEKVEWFKNNFKHIMIKEGWIIQPIINRRYYNIYRITPYRPSNSSIMYRRAYTFAERYGWIINDYGIITNFDENIFNKNKHLIMGTELGLL
jgi:hypothetical protein